MEIITSRENKAVKKYIKLRDKKSERDKSDKFVIEGVKVVCEAVDGNVQIETILITEQCLSKNKDALDNRLIDFNNVHIVTDDIACKMSDTKTPQGIFAVCKKLDKVLTVDKIKCGGFYVCLCGIQDPGNLGTIVRTADGLGADGIILTDSCCDIYSPKAIRSTMGSFLRIDMMSISDEIDFISLLENTVTIASVVDDRALAPYELGKIENGILFIGNEGNGLDKAVSDFCRHKTMIPMKGNCESFNAAVAAGILMWEFLK